MSSHVSAVSLATAGTMCSALTPSTQHKRWRRSEDSAPSAAAAATALPAVAAGRPQHAEDVQRRDARHGRQQVRGVGPVADPQGHLAQRRRSTQAARKPRDVGGPDAIERERQAREGRACRHDGGEQRGAGLLDPAHHQLAQLRHAKLGV
jgi:hypothetical protein